MPVMSIGRAQQDAWIGAGLAGIFSVPFAFLMTNVAGIVGSTGLIAWTKRRSSALSVVLGLPYLIIYSLLPGYVCMQLANLFSTVALVRTPSGVLMVLALLASMYLALSGADTIARVSQAVFLMIIAALFVTLVGAAPNAEFQRLTPVLSRGIAPTLNASMIATIWSVISLGIIPMLTADAEAARRGVRRSACWAVATSHLLLAAMAASTISVFGGVDTGDLVSPAFSLAQSISIAGFAERMEVLMLTVWIGAVTLEAGVFLYVAGRGWADLLGAKASRAPTLVVSLVSSLVALQYTNSIPRVKAYVPPVLTALTALMVIVVAVIPMWLKRVQKEKD